jgi:NhaP-type Na+/H+ or K+/H+ antiporter
MSLKKCHTFVIGMISLLVIYFVTLFVAEELAGVIGPAVVMGIVGACGFYQGTNVADSWQKAKYYQPALDRKGQP